MTSITTNVKHRVRTTGSEHQGQNSISDPDQNLGFTCIFSSGVQECSFFITFENLEHFSVLFVNTNDVMLKYHFPQCEMKSENSDFYSNCENYM